MAAISEHHIRLAQQLPPRLLNFFRKHPPRPVVLGSSSNGPDSSSPPVTIAENTSAWDPNDVASTTVASSSNSSPLASVEPPLADWKKGRNPFLPIKNPRTGAWHGPAYSLRRQADLFRLAETHHVLPLMPWSPKHPEAKWQKRLERELREGEGGTGVSAKVKGRKWERTLRGRLAERQRAMENMPALIREWKAKGSGKGWRKWPSG